jgi:hypothetical protein
MVDKLYEEWLQQLPSEIPRAEHGKSGLTYPQKNRNRYLPTGWQTAAERLILHVSTSIHFLASWSRMRSPECTPLLLGEQDLDR